MKVSFWQGDLCGAGAAPKRMIVSCASPLLWAGALHALSAIFPAAVAAQDAEKAGFSGFISVGVGAASSETNMVAGIKAIGLGEKAVSSIDGSPSDENVILPNFSFELAYAFSETGTEIFVGNLLEDFLRLDLQTNFGVRQQGGKFGVFSLAATASPFSTEVWEDPYIEGERRRKADRTGEGIRIGWSKIFSSPMALKFSSREMEIDQERSGVSLGLLPAERQLLDRNGDVRKGELLYDWQLGDFGRLVPSIAVIDRNFDGAAMAEDGYQLQLTHYLPKGRWRFVSNLALGKLESSTLNPIYRRERETDIVGASFTAFYAQPFQWKGWAVNGGFAYFEEDSNIDFYDSKLLLANVGIIYRFQ